MNEDAGGHMKRCSTPDDRFTTTLDEYEVSWERSDFAADDQSPDIVGKNTKSKFTYELLNFPKHANSYFDPEDLKLKKS